MATRKRGDRIDELLQAEQWDEARALIARALKKQPRNHWLLTQLGETYYEQREYKKALEVLLRSRDILPDCPLTLWHLAGTLDALGDHAGAIRLYTWLLRSKRTPKDDPCWESAAWAEALKTDCIFRLGLCFKHLKQREPAAYCFRKYIDVCLLGTKGSYPIEEAAKHLQELPERSREMVAQELQETADWVLHTSGEEATPTTDPPELDRRSLEQLQEA